MYWPHRYRIREALERAISLQERYDRRLGGAIPELMRLAVEGEDNNSPELPIILCRLLFVNEQQEPLRWPALGQPGHLGDSSGGDWPWSPIHIHNHVPFCVVHGYSVAGFPEPPTWYLTFCLQDGVWNRHPYRMPTDVELREALEDFVANGPWKRPLDEQEIEFLSSQID